MIMYICVAVALASSSNSELSSSECLPAGIISNSIALVNDVDNCLLNDLMNSHCMKVMILFLYIH